MVIFDNNESLGVKVKRLLLSVFYLPFGCYTQERDHECPWSRVIFPFAHYTMLSLITDAYEIPADSSSIIFG